MSRNGINFEHHGRQTGNAAGRFYLPGHADRNRKQPMKKSANIRSVMTGFTGHTLNGLARFPDKESYIYTHGSNSVVSLQQCQDPEEAKNARSPHNPSMPRWKYRDAFEEDYWAYKERSGLTHDEIAEFLGKSAHTVASYRRKGDSCVIPPESVIRKAAALFGVSPFKYMDDPRVSEGVGLEAYADMPQWMKDALQQNARAMDGSTLDPAQWRILIDSMISQARAIEAASTAGKKKT